MLFNNAVFGYFLESSGEDVSPETKLNGIMHLAELCIDLLHQNEEHHAEVRRANKNALFLTAKYWKTDCNI